MPPVSASTAPKTNQSICQFLNAIYSRSRDDRCGGDTPHTLDQKDEGMKAINVDRASMITQRTGTRNPRNAASVLLK